MWKIFLRYVREPLERKFVNRENIDASQRKQMKVTCSCRFVPRMLIAAKRFNQNRLVYHLINDDGSEHSNKNQSWRKHAYLSRRSWAETFGLSGALAFGWSLGQHLHYFRKPEDYGGSVDNQTNGENPSKSAIIKCNLQKLGSLHPFVALNPVVLAQPVSFNEIDFTYKTERKLKKEVENLVDYHNYAIGDIENGLGNKCVGKKKYRKAVIHYTTAASVRNADALYNLAQCYELGLGTTHDFQKAAKCYAMASELGHATATYNLGIFYAHGWGGLKSNSDKAKELFEKAADLGQPEAQELVNLRFKQSPILPNGVETDYIPHNFPQDDNKAMNTADTMAKFINIDAKISEKFDGNTSSTGYFSSSPINVESDFSDTSICGHEIPNKSPEGNGKSSHSTTMVNNNAEVLYNLASAYEESVTKFKNNDQVSYLMELYKLSASHGHPLAKERVKALEIYDAFGILADYLYSEKENIAV